MVHASGVTVRVRSVSYGYSSALEAVPRPAFDDRSTRPLKPPTDGRSSTT